MTEEEQEDLQIEIARLRQEHQDLDAAIAAMALSGKSDPLAIQRMKKKKLSLKDRIAILEDKIIPDIIA